MAKQSAPRSRTPLISHLSCTLPLPLRFRAGDVIAFNGRDHQEIAERVTESFIQKGMVWRHRPACLTIGFERKHAHAELVLDGKTPSDSQADFEAMVRRMLGLDQDVERFERRYRHHPQLGTLIARQAGLRVPASATPFEALTWAVAAQQISVKAAVALRRNLILAAGIRHSEGLLCYPAPEQVATLTEEQLRQAGFSATKTRTLLTLADLATRGELPLDAWLRMLPTDDIRKRLLAVHGVGTWTVDYTLLRGFGWLNGSLHGDVAVRRGLQLLLHSPDKISEEVARTWLAPFAPWRALVAAHLWAMQTVRA